jgi:polyisoprenoid-binding protein YceI
MGTVTTWQIDPAHTDIGFEVKHLMISKVRGRFGTVTGTIHLDETDVTRSSVEAEIDTTTIDTREAQRDAHLRSADFFDVESFPKITFRSTRVERVDEDHATVVGDLTIRGTTREVKLSVEEEGKAKDPWGGDRIAFSATAKIDRRDFGLTWNQALEAGGVLVANEIKLILDVQAVKAPAEQAA